MAFLESEGSRNFFAALQFGLQYSRAPWVSAAPLRLPVSSAALASAPEPGSGPAVLLPPHTLFSTLRYQTFSS